MDTALLRAAAVLLALAACSADRGARAPRDTALPDSAPLAAPGELPDADSLSAMVSVFEFAEAGSPLTVPVLGVPPDSSAAEWNQRAELLGSVGPLVFVRTSVWSFACGAHGGNTDSLVVLDLAARRGAALLDDSARAALERAYRAEAAVAYKADTSGEQPFSLDSSALTMLIPRLTGARLTLTYQFTADACYACSDQRWSSYTRSVRLPARELPPALALYADIPLEVQTAFRIQRVAADSGAGWSQVRMPRAQRDALARLFGVTAPAGGAEFLVWRALPGGSFETVWLRGGGVEATIVGRQPGVWIAAGGRAWNWKSRTERVATVPCSQQREMPKP
jgi:hypothetical protein